MTKAKRGDLVVIHSVSSSWSRDYGHTETDEYSVGVVTSITRDGVVKCWRHCDDHQETDHIGRPYRGQLLARVIGFRQCWVMSAADIGVTGALATAACHTWAGHETTQPYASLDDVRRALQPHAGSAREVLDEAAAVWLLAVTDAGKALDDAYQAAGRAQAAAGYWSRESSAVHHEATSRALEAWSAARAVAYRAYRASYDEVTTAVAA